MSGDTVRHWVRAYFKRVVFIAVICGVLLGVFFAVDRALRGHYEALVCLPFLFAAVATFAEFTIDSDWMSR